MPPRSSATTPSRRKSATARDPSNSNASNQPNIPNAMDSTNSTTPSRTPRRKSSDRSGSSHALNTPGQGSATANGQSTPGQRTTRTTGAKTPVAQGKTTTIGSRSVGRRGSTASRPPKQDSGLADSAAQSEGYNSTELRYSQEVIGDDTEINGLIEDIIEAIRSEKDAVGVDVLEEKIAGLYALVQAAVSSRMGHLKRLQKLWKLTRSWRDSCKELDLQDSSIFWSIKTLTIKSNFYRLRTIATRIVIRELLNYIHSAAVKEGDSENSLETPMKRQTKGKIPVPNLSAFSFGESSGMDPTVSSYIREGIMELNSNEELNFVSSDKAWGKKFGQSNNGNNNNNNVSSYKRLRLLFDSLEDKLIDTVEPLGLNAYQFEVYPSESEILSWFQLDPFHESRATRVNNENINQEDEDSGMGRSTVGSNRTTQAAMKPSVYDKDLTEFDTDIYILADLFYSRDELIRCENLLQYTNAGERDVKCGLLMAKATLGQQKFDVALDWMNKGNDGIKAIEEANSKDISGVKRKRSVGESNSSIRSDERSLKGGKIVGGQTEAEQSAATKCVLESLMAVNEEEPTFTIDSPESHPILPKSAQCIMRGKIYHLRSETVLAQNEYQLAIKSDIRCIEGWKWILENYCLTPAEQRAFIEEVVRDSVAIVDESQDHDRGDVDIAEEYSGKLKLSQFEFDFIISFYILMANKAYDSSRILVPYDDSTTKPTYPNANSMKLNSFVKEMELKSSPLTSIIQSCLNHYSTCKNGGNTINSQDFERLFINSVDDEFLESIGASVSATLGGEGGIEYDDDDIRQRVLPLTRIIQYVRESGPEILDFLEYSDESSGTMDLENDTNVVRTSRGKRINLLDKLEFSYGLKGDSDLINFRGKQLFNQRKHDECFSLVDKLLQQDNFNKDSIVLHISNVLQTGNVNYMFLFTHRLVEQYPRWCVSWFSVGVYYLMIRNNLEARKYFTKATLMEQRFGEAWVAFAQSFAEEGEIDQSLAAFGTTIRYFKGMHEPLIFVAIQCIQISNVRLAKEYLNQAAVLSECVDPCVLNELAVIAMRDQDFKRAQRYLLTSLVVLSNSQTSRKIWSTVWFNLGYVFRRRGEYRLAIKCLEKVLLLNGVQMGTQGHTSVTNDSGGYFNTESSTSSNDSSNADIYLNLAINYQLLNNYHLALQNYHRALALDPYTQIIKDFYVLCIENWKD